MEKRYQVFVSSTYRDLQDERQEVMQALLELDCIPSGMELFPAANDDKWTLIKKVIDDCDYYIVIVAGRYGSLGPSGISYTEMEYRYAVERGKPVIGFTHRSPGSLPVDRSETDPEARTKLDQFRSFVQQKVCRFWDTPVDLGSQVSRSLIKLIKTTPAVGWIRADQVTEAASAEMLRLRRTIEELQAGIEAVRTEAPPGTEQLAQGDDLFKVTFLFNVEPKPPYTTFRSETYTSDIEISWNDMFSAIGPHMIDEATEPTLKQALNIVIEERGRQRLREFPDLNDLRLSKFVIDEADFQTVKIQLRAIGLINKSTKPRSVKDTTTYWSLTPYGDSVLTRIIHHPLCPLARRCFQRRECMA